MRWLLVSAMMLVWTPVLPAQETLPLQCNGDFCEECMEAELGPIPMGPRLTQSLSWAAAAAALPDSVEIVVTHSPKTGEIVVESMPGAGVDKIKTTPKDFTDGVLNKDKVHEVRQAIRRHEAFIRGAKKYVKLIAVDGLRWTAGALFAFALDGSVALGKYAAKEVDAWVAANNRGEDCSKLVRWLAETAKTCTGDCADCYAKRLATIPGAATATQCYADLTAVTGKAFPEIEQQVNDRAQQVVSGCGGRKGGYASQRNAMRPLFDGINVPSLEKVCPYR